MEHYRYNGFINIYKESGWTSMDVCAKLKGILGVRKIGHAGTLDPMAEGVLPVAIGRSTKDIDSVGGCIKEYTAGMLLGMTTDTEDITGEVTSRFEGAMPDAANVKAAILSFIGSYDQLTPMYSARKVNGKKLYEYARAGKEVERKTKLVQIYDIRIDEMELPHVTFTVQCSQGTYIRSLCRDIGEKLGCGACMDSLLRNQVGDFRIEDALKLSEVSNLAETGSIDSVLRIKHPSAVSIGKFDGTHIGHQALLKELKKTAEKNKLRTVVLILKFGKTGVLSDAERKKRLYDLGIDYCIELEFTEELKNMTAEDFLEKILIGRFNMKAMVAGKDVSFGKGKAGNAEFLYANAETYGYTVNLIDKIQTDEVIKKAENALALDKENDGQGSFIPASDISSTMLRAVIKEGDMKHAALLLGAPYSISGVVVHGKGLAGTKMNYPTMNVEVADELTVPPYGVYAVRTIIYDDWKPGQKKTGEQPFRKVDGIANLGERPTVNGSVEGGTRLRLEVHAFDDIGDCYGKTVKVEFIQFIRSERKFDSIDDLMHQILDIDLPKTQKALAENA